MLLTKNILERIFLFFSIFFCSFASLALSLFALLAMSVSIAMTQFSHPTFHKRPTK